MRLKNHLISFVGVFCLTGMGIAVLALGGSSGCGSSVSRGVSGEGDLSSITVAESEVAAGSEFTPNVSFFVTDENGLGIRALGVDVNNDGTAGTPTVKDITVAEGDTIALRIKGQEVDDFDFDDDCAEEAISEGEEDTPVDIGISLDTSGSMGGASGVLAGKIADFAQFLVDNKVDARFAAVTVGDAHATKETTGSAYDDTVSEGTLGAPPDAIDSIERPDTGTSLLEVSDLTEFFGEVETNIGTGTGGGDFPENYLGALEFLNDRIGWRTDATRVLISLGDDCAHTPDSQTFITGDWAPPDPDGFIDALNGTVPVHVVTDTDKSCSTTYDMTNLAAATGGSTTDKGDCTTETDCAVDLTTLPIATSIAEGVNGECDLTVGDLTTVTVCTTVQITDGGSTFEGTCCYVLTVEST